MSLWGQQLLCWGASCQKYFIMKVKFLSRPFIINSHRCRGALNTDSIYCTNWHIINHKSHPGALLLYLAFQRANCRESFNLCIARIQKVNFWFSVARLDCSEQIICWGSFSWGVGGRLRYRYYMKGETLCSIVTLGSSVWKIKDIYSSVNRPQDVSYSSSWFCTRFPVAPTAFCWGHRISCKR